jgi:hypothetical protein
MGPLVYRACERCGSKDTAEIIYGMVTPDVEAEYPNQRIVLGGCVVEATSPRWQCLCCGQSWGRTLADERSGK